MSADSANFERDGCASIKGPFGGPPKPIPIIRSRRNVWQLTSLPTSSSFVPEGEAKLEKDDRPNGKPDT